MNFIQETNPKSMSNSNEDLERYDLVKNCSNGGIVQRKMNFHKHRRSKDGINVQCKSCHKIHIRMYYNEIRVRKLEYCKKNHYENRERQLEYKKRYYNKTRDQKLELKKREEKQTPSIN